MTKSSLVIGRFNPLKDDMRILAVFLSVFIVAPDVYAKDALRGEEVCFPAKGVSKLVDKLNKIDPERRDVVNVSLDAKFLRKDGGAWPERFYLKQDGAIIKDMAVMTEDDGRVPSFLSSIKGLRKADICVLDPTRASRSEHYEGLYFEMGLSPLYHNRSGRHELAELVKGVKDGKVFYKKMIPSAVRLLMPDSDYLAVRYDDFRRDEAALFAEVEGELIPLETERYKDMHIVSCETLEDMNAAALVIKGGAYQLQPSFSVKTLKRYGWGDEE